MPTSPYWADVKVEVAFNAGFATAAASRVWTDVSDYVEAQDGITINFGRNDERSQADANTLSLTLDNRDGRFTPGKTAGAYYPNVKLYRPIRVTATPPGGAASVRFVGYVLQWNVEWPEGTDAHAVCQVSASSRLQRLGLADQRRSVIEETVFANADSVAGYFTLSEPAEATSAADSSGQGLRPLTQIGLAPLMTFGSATGPPTDGMSAAQFNEGQHLAAEYAAAVALTAEPWLSVFFLTTDVSGRIARIASGAANLGVAFNLDVGLNGSGQVLVTFAWQGIGVGSVVSAAAYNDGATHHMLVTGEYDSPGVIRVRLYMDGTQVATDTFSDSGVTLAPTIGYVKTGSDMTISVAHLAFGSGWASSAATMASDVSISGSTAFASETTATRFARLAAWARIPPAEVATSGTARTVVASEPQGSGVVDLMRQLETTEQGVLYDARDGTLTLVGASGRYSATSPAYTLDMGAQKIGADYAPVFDVAGIVNDVTVTQAGETGASARVIVTTSRDAYGIGADSPEIVSALTEDTNHLAAWLAYAYSEPQGRIPNITVSVAESVGLTPSPDTLLATTIGTLIRLSNRPTQDDATTLDLFVEGYTETMTPAAHDLSLNVSLAAPENTTLILGHATRGVLGTNPLAY